MNNDYSKKNILPPVDDIRLTRKNENTYGVVLNHYDKRPLRTVGDCYNWSFLEEGIVSKNFNVNNAKKVNTFIAKNFVNSLKKNGIEVLSFDFDQTLTNEHTFHAFARGSMKPLKEYFGEEQISLIKSLINECKKQGVEFVITSRSYRKNLNRMLDIIFKEEGENVKIFGGDDLEYYNGNDVRTGNKADTLHKEFKEKKILHIDDSIYEGVGFSKNEFYHVKYNKKLPAFNQDSMVSLTKKLQQNHDNYQGL